MFLWKNLRWSKFQRKLLTETYPVSKYLNWVCFCGNVSVGMFFILIWLEQALTLDQIHLRARNLKELKGCDFIWYTNAPALYPDKNIGYLKSLCMKIKYIYVVVIYKIMFRNWSFKKYLIMYSTYVGIWKNLF